MRGTIHALPCAVLSLEHEIPIHILRSEPAVVAELLRLATHTDVVFASARLGPTDLGDVQPTERRADLVIELLDDDGNPSQAVIVEVQRQEDPLKRFRWPLYLASLHDRIQCKVHLVVLALDEDVARWARKPIETLIPTCRFVPLVLEPSLLTSLKQEPALVVLQASISPREDNLKAALGAIEALCDLDEPRAREYFDLLEAIASRDLEKLMTTEQKHLYSEWARKHFREGLAEGKAEGRAEGKADGIAEAVVSVLERRGLAPSDDERARIVGCRDLDRLKDWLARAVICERVSDIFDTTQ